MKVRRLLWLVIMLFAVSMVMAGCGGGTTSEKKAGEPQKVYPEKEITFIIPWAAGGGTDRIGRQLASLIEKELGKPVVVVNKSGGGGVVGFQEIANAKPDGYTIGLISISLLLQKYTATTYVDYKTLKPIAVVNEDPASLTVKKDAPWNTLLEFIEAAKKEPEKFRVANSGPGAVWHTAALILEKLTGAKFKHIPYNNSAEAAAAVAGGHVEATTASASEVWGLVESGQLKILANASPQRLPKWPDIPTFKEAGVDMSFGVWRAVVAPKDTPDEIIQVLNKAIEKAVNSQEYKDFMTNNGFGILYKNAKEAQAFMDKQDAELGELLKGLGIKKQ